MSVKKIKDDHKPLIFTIFLTLYFCVSWVLYSAFGRRFILKLHETKFTEFLNSIMVGEWVDSLEFYFGIADKMFLNILISLPVLVLMALLILKPNRIHSWFVRKDWLEKFTDSLDSIPDSRIGPYIALSAGIGLFIELLIIRFHSSCFQLFAYFKNVSLLSCFLGLGIGYARGSKRPINLPLVMPFLALQFVLMHSLRFSPMKALLQNPVSEQITMGLGQATTYSVFFVYLFLALIFAFNALCFIPLGQLVTHLMSKKDRLISYGWNLTGSLLGIFVFSALSLFWTPPIVWILVAALMLVIFFVRNITTFLPSILASTIVLIFLSIPANVAQFDVYSPYQILSLVYSKYQPVALKTSNAYFQKILDLRPETIKNNEKLKKWSEYYELPYFIKNSPENVLVVGSGTGNDVAAAVRNNAKNIDAVEIDPAILAFGKELHPESPYQSPNVNAIVDDARSYIRKTGKKYDLIVYGLLDSHIMLSGKGGIRLDSYVYTVEAFREARKKLKSDGALNLTFCIMTKQLGRKLYVMLEEAFDGKAPIVYKVGYDAGYTFLCGDNLEKDSVKIPAGFSNVTSEFADFGIKADKSTDDWPFFYMPVRKYPVSYIVMIVILLVLSALLIRNYLPQFGGNFSGPCFFLGAGFMLLETKAITELALVYGSTWIIVSIVITGILIMAFLANLLVIKKGMPSPFISYGLLIFSIFAGLGMTFFDLGNLPVWLSRILMTVILTLPLFFSGFAFSSEMKKTKSAGIALSSNLFGAMLGGFLEYNSMYFGFKSLYFIAIVIYIFAFASSAFRKQS